MNLGQCGPLPMWTKFKNKSIWTLANVDLLEKTGNGDLCSKSGQNVHFNPSNAVSILVEKDARGKGVN